MRRGVFTVGVSLLVLAAPAGSAPGAPGAEIGPFVVAATGGQNRDRQTNNQNPDPLLRLAVSNRSSYRGAFNARFTIDQLGNIHGAGEGRYTALMWRLEGVNSNLGFACNPPVTVPQSFQITIAGRVRKGVLELRFSMSGAEERNDDYDCGAGFTAFATTSTYLSESLNAVQAAQPGGVIKTSLTNPSVGALTAIHTDQLSDGTRTVENSWELTVTAPSPLQDPNNNGGRGGSAGPARGPGDPRAAICTIAGTPRRDRLNGTNASDVICGFGGNDTINAKGGNDTVFGGSGADTVTGGPGQDALYGDVGPDLMVARDRGPDIVDGGVGRDRGRVDRGRDRVRSVEDRG